MSEILEFLKSVDDDYLIGLSNKGIVKRSHKDLESESFDVQEKDGEIHGKCGDVSTCLKMPLTNSTCSCPSSSICKHIIMTILTAKENLSSQEQARDAKQETQEELGQTHESKQDNPEERKQETESIQETREEREDAGTVDHETQEKPNQSQETAESVVQRLKDLRKDITEKQWKQVISQIEGGVEREITYGSLITVRNLSEGYMVKIASPLAFSTCSACHSEKICVHKVFAVLVHWLDSSLVTMDDLAMPEEETVFDPAETKRLLGDLRVFLEEILRLGSARLSPETAYGLERMAIRCHEAGMADFENRMRELAEKVSGYQARRASVTVTSILIRIAECVWLLEAMERAMLAGKSIAPLAGEFRSEYRDMPELILQGLGMRSFSGASYDGQTVYFLEENSGRFYTYTIAMPNIYDQAHGNGNRMFGAGQVPWGLPCTLLQFSTAKIRLRQGKASDGRRLSSTTTASAELLGVDIALGDAMADLIFDDFELLWKEYEHRVASKMQKGKGVPWKGRELEETDKLFLIRPSEVLDMRYDETEQKLVFYLEDPLGRRLRGELAYSKQEENAIKSMERMEKSRKRDGRPMPVFVGSLYVRDGECIFYPIETIKEERLK